MAETETAPQTNGIDTIAEEEEYNKSRPADIEADMREMERRKRVEGIMNSRLFREELERIVDSQMRDGGSSNILQQLSDIMGMPAARVGSVFKSSNCVVPINDIRGMEAMGYEKGEKILRCKLAAAFRLVDLYGWSQGIDSLITARLNADQELFLVNPFGVLNHEITASSLNKVNMQGQIVEQGTTNFGVNTSQFILHSVIHAARPDIRCAIFVGCNSVVAISALKQGLLPLTKDGSLLGEISVHTYTGGLNEPEEKDKLLRSLGPVSKVLLLSNHGAICCGETVEEAFFAVTHIVAASEAQLKLLPIGLDNLIIIPEETRKAIYDASRKPPEGLITHAVSADNKERSQAPKWRVGGAEFEALMRMLDNAGFRTGYIYRNPLVKNDLPKPKNDVEVPPAVSSLGYLIEEEELFKQGIWKKGDFRKGGDRSRWLNSPNVYQKVEVLETGTPDPKKITKWIAEVSPIHSSTPVKIESAMQFVPPNTNPKEFKRIQQQIKDYRRADKISAGPQSHILEGVSWDEANRLKDANVSATGDHVVLMGAASKGIIQRGYQHNATVYKAPYAKNPFDSVTDDELNEYKKTVEKKQQGDYTDTDFSESEALSSLQISEKNRNQPPNQSEPEDTEHQVLRIETKQVPKPSQPEVVLSDADFPEIPIECSMFNPTRKQLCAEGGSIRLDSTDIKILQKIDNHSRSYGSVPVLYHKIGEQILNRKDYDTGMNSPKVTCATQTENVGQQYLLTSVETQTCSKMKCQQLKSEYNPRVPLQKTVKNCRSRNFIMENIQKVKHKHLFSNLKRNKLNESDIANKTTPTTVKAVKTVRKHRKHLKRRSLQCSTKDEYGDNSTVSTGKINNKLQIMDFSACLQSTCNSQLECISTITNTLDQMRNDVDEIVQLQGEIDLVRHTHSEIVSLRTTEDNNQVNESVLSSYNGNS